MNLKDNKNLQKRTANETAQKQIKTKVLGMLLKATFQKERSRDYYFS